jgi:hypothetical protein
MAHAASPWLETRLEEIARDIRALRVGYDEWQIVYRQALQLGRALRGQRQLLEEAGGDEVARIHTSVKEAHMATPRNDIANAEAARALTTRELIAEIAGTASLLARKEVELAKTEINADLRSQLAMAKSLGVAAPAALLGLNLLLVAGVLALAPFIAP